MVRTQPAEPPIKLTDLNLLRQQAYVDGQWIDADDASRFAVTNPANGELIAEVAALGKDETSRAINAAEAAWRDKTTKERAAILRNWYELIMANQKDLARLLSWEQGKPLAESRDEIAYDASFSRSAKPQRAFGGGRSGRELFHSLSEQA